MTTTTKPGVLAVSVIDRITNAAIDIAVRRANTECGLGEAFTAAELVATVAADPHGNTAHYLANLIVTGAEHYALFRSIACTPSE